MFNNFFPPDKKKVSELPAVDKRHVLYIPSVCVCVCVCVCV